MAVISGSGMAAFVMFQLRSEEGWHHEDNRPCAGSGRTRGVFYLEKKEQEYEAEITGIQKDGQHCK